MSRATDYTNASQQRVLRVLMVLFSDVVIGLPPVAIAKAANSSSSNIIRDLDNLATAGLAERDESTGNWRLTPRLPQQAIKIFSAIDRAERRVSEAKNRFTRNPD